MLEGKNNLWIGTYAKEGEEQKEMNDVWGS